ncbi:DNA/RNA helicase domain-containing protein [Kribbella qitaiheensis]|uniref:DNA/RNA helicase domain-containing protein n=1 Tax=Kribbella qitaiheensis TaxID=1544730 RepID=UPI003608DFF5
MRRPTPRQDPRPRRLARNLVPPQEPQRRPQGRRGSARRPLGHTEPNGFDQVGCVYTAQGFEYGWSGVIIGPDLVWRNGHFTTIRDSNKASAFRNRNRETVNAAPATYFAKAASVTADTASGLSATPPTRSLQSSLTSASTKRQTPHPTRGLKDCKRDRRPTGAAELDRELTESECSPLLPGGQFHPRRAAQRRCNRIRGDRIQ